MNYGTTTIRKIYMSLGSLKGGRQENRKIFKEYQNLLKLDENNKPTDTEISKNHKLKKHKENHINAHHN